MAAHLSLPDYLSASAEADTTDALNDEETVHLVSSTQEMWEGAHDPGTAEPPVPALLTTDLLRRFAGTHEGTQHALNALECYEISVRPFFTKRTQAKLRVLFRQKKIPPPLWRFIVIILTSHF